MLHNLSQYRLRFLKDVPKVGRHRWPRAHLQFAGEDEPRRHVSHGV